MSTPKDDLNQHYKYPDRSCKICKNYPCLEDLDKLRSDPAKYGCVNYD